MATKQSKDVPPLTRGHVAVPRGDKLYRWGGLGSEQRRNMVDVFDVKKEQWECLTTRGPPPPGIENCAYTVIGSSLFTFGGEDEGRSYHNSIHQLNTKTMEWRELVPQNPSDAPQKKTECGMVSLDDDKLVVFAGYTGPDKRTDELHVFNTKKMTWTPQRTTGRKPPPLSGFTFTKIDATRAVVFGCNDGNIVLNNDVYILNMRKWEWVLLGVSGGPKLSVRIYHAACCLAGPLTGQEHPLLVVVGGRRKATVLYGDGSKVFDDVWLLDIDGRRWKQVTLPEEILPRWHHSATVFGAGPDYRQLVLWGGVKTAFGYLDGGRKKFLGTPIGETTLLNFDLTRGEWKVTSVVEEEQLGKTEENLREKMGKLWEKMGRLWPQPTQTPTRAAERISSQEGRRGREEQQAKEREVSMRKDEKLLKTPPQFVPHDSTDSADSTLPQKVEMKPEMFELKFTHKVVGTVQADWADLAYALRFQSATVKAIKKDADDVNEACTSVLSKWLDGEGEREPRTWATLLEALTDMGKTELAKEIGKKLK